MERGKYRDYRPPAAQHRKPVDARGAGAAAPEMPPARRRQLAPRKFGWRPAATLILLAGLIYLSYGYVHTKHQLEQLSNPKTATESATQQLIDKVGKLVQLPSNETPIVASINNAASLRAQGGFERYFYANAQNGDKLLIYTKNNLAIIYRPSTGKVISSGPYDLSKLIQQNGSGQ